MLRAFSADLSSSNFARIYLSASPAKNLENLRKNWGKFEELEIWKI
jgi:hypothetical protein